MYRVRKSCGDSASLAKGTQVLTSIIVNVGRENFFRFLFFFAYKVTNFFVLIKGLGQAKSDQGAKRPFRKRSHHPCRVIGIPQRMLHRNGLQDPIH